jgi:exopolyphosphatase/guanosine-5'-triphosphate,3'-diphosphate pyrophosphatase
MEARSVENEPIKAVMDVGTNSIKLLVAKASFGPLSVIADIVSVCRLGEGLEETGVLSPAAMERSAAAIEEMSGAARGFGAGEITAVGTQALRAARNADEFIRLARVECGVEIRVISGDEEALLSFMAVRSAMREDPPCGIIVFDVGGGSSEAIYGRDSAERRLSIPVGALSLRARFFAPSAGAVSDRATDEAGSYVSSVARGAGFAPDADLGNEYKCFGVGGTATTLASVFLKGDWDGVDGTVLGRSEIDRQIAMYARADAESRRKIEGLPPDRADIILPGACIVKELMKMASRDELVVSCRGLRHGLMESQIE